MLLVIPVFVPHAGCPHDCCFCNQKIISGQASVPASEDVINTIETFKLAAPRYDEVQLAFYGGSFTAVDESLQIMFLETVQPYLKRNGGFIDTLRLSTRPDCIDDDVLARLKKYGASIVELGLQSMDDAVLKKSGRGHDAQAAVKAVGLLRKHGFTVGLQTMTGLPGADSKSDIFTAKQVCELKPDFVRVYPTIVVNGTALHRSYLKGEYVPQPIEATVELCAELFGIYKEAGIKVVRMGLQSSDNISDDGEVAAGPYHPAFGQLVKSKILLNNICVKTDRLLMQSTEYCTGMKLPRKFLITVYVQPRMLSDYIGQKRSNVEALMQKYGADVKIKKYPKDDAEFAKYEDVFCFEKGFLTVFMQGDD